MTNEYTYKKVTELTGYELRQIIIDALRSSKIPTNDRITEAIGKFLPKKLQEDGDIKC